MACFSFLLEKEFVTGTLAKYLDSILTEQSL